MPCTVMCGTAEPAVAGSQGLRSGSTTSIRDSSRATPPGRTPPSAHAGRLVRRRHHRRAVVLVLPVTRLGVGLLRALSLLVAHDGLSPPFSRLVDYEATVGGRSPRHGNPVAVEVVDGRSELVQLRQIETLSRGHHTSAQRRPPARALQFFVHLDRFRRTLYCTIIVHSANRRSRGCHDSA